MHVCGLSPTSSLFCCKGKPQQPAPGPLEELWQMSLRKSKYLRDEFPSIVKSIHHGLILSVCSDEAPVAAAVVRTVSGRSCSLGAGKI